MTPDAVPRRELGRTGLTVPALCLGTMTWGQQNDAAEAFAQMDLAFAHGVDFFDAAEMYPIPPRAETQGETERMIGAWFAARGTRNRVLLATKVCGRDGFPWLRGRATRLDRANITAALDASLTRLRTDRIDLYQLHWPDRRTPMFGIAGTTYKHIADPDAIPIEETLGVLADLVAGGKIRHVGLSNETAWGTMRFLAASERAGLPRVAAIQNAYNLVNRTFEIGLAEIAMNEQVGLLAYSPLGQGYLTGKYLNGARPAGARSTLFNRGQRYEKPGAEAAIAAYVGLAAELGVDPAVLALAFVTSRKFVTANIIGATSLDQLRIALGSVSYAITPDIEARIDAIHQLHANPCP